MLIGLSFSAIADENEKAKAKALGSKYDIRDYHDVVLKNGAVPLEVLEQGVEEWMVSIPVAGKQQTELVY